MIDGPDGDDPTVRPNQLLAVSLPASPLEGAVQRRVLEQCGDRLLTSYACDHWRLTILATVAITAAASPSVTHYHQGPVWAWLLGHWALAYYRVHGNAAAAQAWLVPITDRLADAGLGQVSEIFDGDPRHTPRGAPTQAWSVACVLEAWWRLERAKLASAASKR